MWVKLNYMIKINNEQSWRDVAEGGVVGDGAKLLPLDYGNAFGE